jgi:sec-independent protein translocase protein TatC
VLFPFANDIYTFVAEPIRAQLPEGSQMIATQVASPFLTPFKLALVAAVFVAMPYLLYQVWGFVAPGLYTHEKRLAVPLLASSIVLFYLGMTFAYFVVFPLVFGFFTSVTPDGVAQMPDIAFYLEFVLKLFFAFGIAFEIPIATILLVAIGATTPEALAQKRPYVIVGVFVAGMLLTPPDVVSQTLLAIPMWLLFEARHLLFALEVGAHGVQSADPLQAEPPKATARILPRRPHRQRQRRGGEDLSESANGVAADPGAGAGTRYRPVRAPRAEDSADPGG